MPNTHLDQAFTLSSNIPNEYGSSYSQIDCFTNSTCQYNRLKNTSHITKTLHIITNVFMMFIKAETKMAEITDEIIRCILLGNNRVDTRYVTIK